MKSTILLALIITIFTVGCTNDSNDLSENEIDLTLTLTEDEVSDLLFLREEEKLARDVYLYSYNKYGQQIFKNISDSESKHMNSVLELLNKYNIEDPVLDEVGKFKDEHLQEIYDALIEKSEVSLIEALLVGNTIEDLDIYDISKNEERTDREDILTVYNSLKCGSRNHLRSFNSLVLNNDVIYTVQYITDTEFNEIINSSKEQCN